MLDSVTIALKAAHSILCIEGLIGIAMEITDRTEGLGFH